MFVQKSISQILIFALIISVCIFTTACTQEKKSSISIQHESKLSGLQKKEVRNSRIVYLWESDERNYNIGNFGPRDIYFADETSSLR